MNTSLTVNIYSHSSLFVVTLQTLRALCVWQEIFGPVLSVYVYPEKDYREVLQLIDNTSPYALTGAVYAQDK